MNYRILIFALLLFQQVKGQQKIRPLSIGEKMPEVYLRKIIQDKNASVYFSSFKQPLIILDFWSIYCSGCVAAMPDMEILQKKFGDQIKILPVTKDKKEVVKSFWDKNKYLKGVKLPSVVEDEILNSYFKHTGEPHEVWIYKGKIVAITYGDYVDEDNIRKILSGEKADFPLKTDSYAFNPKIPLFNLSQHKQSKVPLQYFVIGSYRPDLTELTGGNGIVRDSVKKTVRVYFFNQSILNIYRRCWEKVNTKQLIIKPLIHEESRNEVEWRVKNKSLYTYEHARYLQSWLQENAICFELLKKDNNETDSTIYSNLINELNRYLGLEVKWERKKEKILSLIQIENGGKILGNHNNLETIGKYDKNIFKIENQPLYGLIFLLNQASANPYVFDDRNSDKKVSLTLSVQSWSNIDDIKKQLLPYGLSLKEKFKEVDKLVFKEN